MSTDVTPSPFVGLHIHSDYSLLDGASQLPALIDRAVELGMPAIALTDHGVMYGAIELIKTCKGRGIKPIIGNEMYLINGDITLQQRRPRYHQVVLAKNFQGYKNLVKLTSISHLQGVQGKGIFSRPCINKELLEQYHEGLIVTSACLGGEVPQAIMQNRPDVARRVAQWYKDLFGDDYYLEIQDHGSPEDRVVNVEIVRIAAELGIKVIATNDSHYISCNDVEAHDALLCIQTGKLLTEDKRLRYSGTEYLKSADEMRQLFQDHLTDDIIESAITTTLEVADKVQDYDGILGAPRIPDFPVPEGFSKEDYMAKVARDGLVARLKCSGYDQIEPTYQARLEYEIDMMQQMGFATYFLVVWDYIRFARERKIPVGPGRGSAAGSLVAYAMGITNIDPVHHGLLFERFLNPERKSMPDIDTDFCIERRDEVIKYVTEKYGQERVAQIITYNRMTSKAVLKDVARVLDIPYGEADRMAKLIPVVRGKPTKLKVMVSDDTPAPEFKEKYDNDPQTRRWLDMAMRIEGTNKSVGIHAAGVVISAQPLDEAVPLQRNKDSDGIVTQYSMEDIEAMGLLKMDFLGLRNLTMIQKAVDLIEQKTGKVIDLDELPLDDPETYKLLARGELGGIFQLESSGMRQIVRDLKPSGLEDISSVLALYRPGPLDAGLIPLFINRKHGRDKVEYQHPTLEPILKETYGVLCLPQGTLIDRPDGSQTPIEQIQSGDRVLTSQGARVTPAVVAKQWFSGPKNILKITLSSGTSLLASEDHRFLTAAGDVAAKQLQPVSTLKNAHAHGSILYERWPQGHSRYAMQPGEAYLLGLLIGDGDLKSSTPNVSCATEEAAIWVSQLMAQTWGGEAKRYFNTRCWYAYAKFQTQPRPTPLTQFLDGVYGGRSWKVRSQQKHLPPQILDYQDQDRLALLRGLWDSDGCYGQGVAYFRSISPQLLQQVGLLLGSFKVAHHIAHNYVYVADLTRFKALMGIVQLPGKLQADLPDNYLPVPSASLAVHLTPELAIADATTRKVARLSLQRHQFLKPKHSQYSQKLGTWEQAYQQVYEATYLQDARPVYVVSVEPWGVENCYDLQMADQSSPYFLAHGVVTHNCYQEQIMKMAQDLAGYSLGQADLLRRAMGKKKVSEMMKHKDVFIKGATDRGVKEKLAEDLFDQMVLFAEYCFNKSHSTAYGFVTFQTAYLKANHPVEYMAALLTSNSGDQDKVQLHIADCIKMNIEVLPPDINRSGIDFTPKDKTILFGLSAVRNVGQGAIECLLASRAADGPFKSLADLCDRVDLRAVNRRALEALIQSGAFDLIEANRNQLMHDLDLVLEWAQGRARDRAIGQGNLFDMLGGSDANNGEATSSYESAPKAPPVDDFEPQKKLQLEKELLGFYISDHPLKSIQRPAKVLAPVSVSEMAEQPDNTLLSAIVMLSMVKPVVTKKGDRMAIVQVEDLTGQVDGVVFPRAYERISEHIVVDARLMVWGKADRRDDQVQFIIEDAEPIEAVRLVMVELDPSMASDITMQNRLRNVLRDNQGQDAHGARVPVVAMIYDAQKRRQFIRLGAQFRVHDPDVAVQALMAAEFRAKAQPLIPA